MAVTDSLVITAWQPRDAALRYRRCGVVLMLGNDLEGRPGLGVAIERRGVSYDLAPDMNDRLVLGTSLFTSILS